MFFSSFRALILGVLAVSACAAVTLSSGARNVADGGAPCDPSQPGCDYKLPVFILHGVTGSDKDMDKLAGNILASYPNRTVVNLSVFNGKFSWITLRVQVPKITEVIRGFVSGKGASLAALATASGATSAAHFQYGYHFVCHSQGSMICRAILGYANDLNVNTFVSLSGPLGGQYGDPAGLLIPAKYANVSSKEAYIPFYTRPVQDTLSVANYWRDSAHYNEYVLGNLFLPAVDNITKGAEFPTPRDNFLRLKRLVLYGSPDDGVISPWQSAFFGVFGPDHTMVINATARDIYVADTFGLRTMDQENRVKWGVVPGILHGDWTDKTDVYKKYIEQELAV